MRRFFLIAIFVAGIGICQPALADIPGSKDHPLISRYPGSTIEWYLVENYRPYRIAVGPVTGYRHIDDWLDIEGRVTRIYYVYDGERKHSEFYSNYKEALLGQDFELLADGYFADANVKKEIGGMGWMGVAVGANSIPTDSGVRLLVGSSSVGGSGYLAAKKVRPQGDAYVTVAIKQFDSDTVVALVDVIEVKSVETGFVTVDAEAIGEDIDEYGRVVLDGLLFDHDKATLKSESSKALAEIARFLQARPDMSFYVVGHTDSTGSFAYNTGLSGDRARAVVDALASDYGIDRKRLDPHGVGPLNPVFSNETDPGKAKNRRVELVQR